MKRHYSYSNAQMVLKLEMFVSLVDFMDVLMYTYQGDGNQSLIAPEAGHFKIQTLCAESLDLMVSNLHLSLV